ncbi:cold-shock protein [Paenibacillus mendelii]|uniref:Cold-shock protein n=1 Tax=Paenibacillus mendelii TaxID=206163 RepID=A0ABV6JHF9_9BACL|nr:cold-shock protein [Paenibacillus mendelii]MCQ6557778.1 cold-shock protein [Paenibacillus mendelii]
MYFRRKSVEDLPQENTAIWTCTQDECNGWIRDDFAFEFMPTCPLCHSQMVSSFKMLPSLANSNKAIKSRK